MLLSLETSTHISNKPYPPERLPDDDHDHRHLPADHHHWPFGRRICRSSAGCQPTLVRRDGAAPSRLSHSAPRALAGRAPAGAKFLALGRRHSCTPPPSPSRARAMHRATGRLTGSGKGSVLAQAAPRLAQPGRPASGLRLTSFGASGGAQRSGVLRLTPNALSLSGSGVRGQNRNLSLISVAERNQHRHSMTPGRLAAVKDRGCPPILACGGEAPCEQKSAPPAPALRGGSADAPPSLTA